MSELPFWFFWVNLAAILVGPIMAVLVAQWLDRQRHSYHRRMDIFRDLMRYRRSILSTEYVGALNLVEVEFNRYPEVISKWRTLYEHLHTPTDEMSSEAVLKAWNEKADRLHALLIHSIARVSRLPLEQLDIIAGYAPRAWQEDENRQRLLQISLLDVINGRKALKVEMKQDLEPHNPYPKAPQ